VAEQIRSSDNGPLVAFMTGYRDPKMREKARELGAVGYFIKPLDYERICSMIGTFFQEGQEMVEVAG
jgi:AmiR/NasT family two-component response regulator